MHPFLIPQIHSAMKLSRLRFMQALWLITLLFSSWNAQAAGTITYIHSDISGSPIAATDKTGAVSWRQSYRPYGDRLLQQDQGSHQQWFSGKSHDNSTGLAYFGARYYDPSIGRFTGIDSVRYKESNLHSFNRYAYANHSPYKYDDPDGRIPLLLLGLAPEGVSALTAVYYAVATRVAISGVYRFGISLAAAEVGLVGPAVTAAGVTAVAAKGVATKTDRLKAHVLNGELDAARREAAGQVVKRKADGTPWDHVHELRDAQRGLLNRIESINRQLGRDGISDAQRVTLQQELGQASRLLDKTEGYLPR
jgi:RHS repeat-associated protein